MLPRDCLLQQLPLVPFLERDRRSSRSETKCAPVTPRPQQDHGIDPASSPRAALHAVRDLRRWPPHSPRVPLERRQSSRAPGNDGFWWARVNRRQCCSLHFATPTNASSPLAHSRSALTICATVVATRLCVRNLRHLQLPPISSGAAIHAVSPICPEMIESVDESRNFSTFHRSFLGGRVSFVHTARETVCMSEGVGLLRPSPDRAGCPRAVAKLSRKLRSTMQASSRVVREQTTLQGNCKCRVVG